MMWQPHSSLGLSQAADLNRALLQCVKDQAHSLKYIPAPDTSRSPKVARNTGNLALVWNVSLKSPELRTHREVELLTTFLARSKLLARADMGLLKAAAMELRGVKHLSGARITSEGMDHDDEPGFRILFEGQLGVYKTDAESGALTMVATTGPDAGIGSELALNPPKDPCNATVVSQTTCLILEVKGKESHHHAIALAARSAALKITKDLDQCHLLSGVPRRADGTMDLLYSIDLVRFKQREALPVSNDGFAASASGCPLFFIQSGTVALFAEFGNETRHRVHDNNRTSASKCSVVAALGPRDLVGEWSMLEQDLTGGRRLHAVAFTVLNVFKITKHDLARHLRLDQTQVQGLVDVWSERFFSAAADNELLSTMTAAEGLEEDLALNCSRKPCTARTVNPVTSSKRFSWPNGPKDSQPSVAGHAHRETSMATRSGRYRRQKLPETFIELAECQQETVGPRRVSEPSGDSKSCQLSAAVATGPLPSSSGYVGGSQQSTQRPHYSMLHRVNRDSRKMLASYPPPGHARGHSSEHFVQLFGPNRVQKPPAQKKPVLPDVQHPPRSSRWDASRIVRGGTLIRRIVVPQTMIPNRTNKMNGLHEEGLACKQHEMGAITTLTLTGTLNGHWGKVAPLPHAASPSDTTHLFMVAQSGGISEFTNAIDGEGPMADTSGCQQHCTLEYNNHNELVHPSSTAPLVEEDNKQQALQSPSSGHLTSQSCSQQQSIQPLRLGEGVEKTFNPAAAAGKLRKKMDYYILK